MGRFTLAKKNRRAKRTLRAKKIMFLRRCRDLKDHFLRLKRVLNRKGLAEPINVGIRIVDRKELA